MKKFLKNIVKLKKISTIKDFRFGTFPSIFGSGSGYTFYRPPLKRGEVYSRRWNRPIPNSRSLKFAIPTSRKRSYRHSLKEKYFVVLCQSKNNLYINIQIMDNPNVILYLHRSRGSNRYSSIFLCNYYIIRC